MSSAHCGEVIAVNVHKNVHKNGHWKTWKASEHIALCEGLKGKVLQLHT